MTTEPKGLDATAWLFVMLGILAVVASIWLRSYFTDAALDKNIQSVSYADKTIWVGLDKELVSIDEHSRLQRIPLESLGIKDDTIRHVLANKGRFILNTHKGNTYRCNNLSSVCKRTNAQPVDGYNNLVLLPNDTYLSVNNFDADIVSYQFETAQRIKAHHYTVPKLRKGSLADNDMVAAVAAVDGFDAKKLYRPNSGHVLDGQYMHSDTGNQRILSWQLKEGSPDFTKSTVVADTKQQPYYFGLVKGTGVKSVDKLVVLEGPSVLANGKLASYDVRGAKTTRQEIPLTTSTISLSDPTMLTQVSPDSFLVMEAKTGHIVSVDFLSTRMSPTVSEFKHTELKGVLTKNFEARSRFEWLSRLAWLLFLVPVGMVFLLMRMGYDLNQEL